MKNAVRNLVAITAANSQVVADTKAAVLALARAKDPEGTAEDSAGRVTFTITWEPAFKEIKEISAQNKDATITLYGDAFALQHWISKAVYVGGKATEDNTYSRIDGANFRRVYEEIFGQAFAEAK